VEDGLDKEVGESEHPILNKIDTLINWSRRFSLWPMFFGLSCCFIEESVALTSRYDLSRFGAEIMRGTPRQSDLLIVSGTVFKKIAPIVRRLYEQMPDPKWVISMGSCSNSGGMYDVYSVVQGVNQILPVDVYIPGCPPRPEAVLQGLVLLQEKIKSEKPARSVFHVPGGSQGTTRPILVDGRTKARDARGPGYSGIPLRGSSVTPPFFPESRSELMWTPPATRIELSEMDKTLAEALQERFGPDVRTQPDASDMIVFHVAEPRLKEVLRYLKTEAHPRYQRLDDLTAVDESTRRDSSRAENFTLVYQLLSYEATARIRLKTTLPAASPAAHSITELWPSANWYEREVFDMFGIRFSGHPNLRRLIMPHDWEGHPLRKSYPGRATEMAPYTLADAQEHQPLEAEAYLNPDTEGGGFLLNFGPHHLATHGLMRFIVSVRGERILDLDMDIGYHHRGVEKIGERQSWHQFIPYTDRVDYLSGAANNLPYLLAVEKLAGIDVPRRAQFIRVMMSELFRISSHLVWLATFAHDCGAMSPNFYNISEREKIMDIVELITGARLHPAWFRLGGVADELPDGWQEPILNFARSFPKKLDELEKLTRKSPIFKARTRGVGRLSLDEAIDWGVTGPMLRACGLAWDLRKKMPYSSYEAFDFEVPTAADGDCYARYLVRVEEMRQSARLIEQAAQGMPDGPYRCPDSRYVLPRKEDVLNDIESLIHHFISVTRGPKIPPGEAYAAVEIPRGEQGYYLVSDGLNTAYRLRIRTPDFANVQTMPLMAVGETVGDLAAIAGSVDYILPDTDR